MADFRKALQKTLRHEGGYVFDKNDPGGETYKGVSRRANPDWPGWPLVTTAKDRDGFPNNLEELPNLQDEVTLLYSRNYWLKTKCHFISSQEIAEKLFDMAVNMGPKSAVKLAQKASNVKADGVIGPKTLAALNSADSDIFMLRFRLEIISKYVKICKGRGSSKRYLYGWIKRAMS